MKKIRLSKKMKFLMGLSGLAVVGVVLPVTLLTSCSSTANPYGPYTVINLNSGSGATNGVTTLAADNTSTLKSSPAIKYDTKRQEYYVWNGDGLYIDKNYKNGSFNNKWISANDVLNYYNYLSNEQVKKVLPSGSDQDSKNARKAILEKYYYTNNGTKADNDLLQKAIENYNFSGLNFVYGVAPTEKMKEISELYNYITIQGNVFKLVSALANELISYGIGTEFADMYNWLANGTPTATNNPLSLTTSSAAQPQNGVTNVVDKDTQIQNAKDFANTSVMQWGQKIQGGSDSSTGAKDDSKSIAKEFTLGVGTIVGEGKNTYHLWPSGFNAKFTWTEVSTADNGSKGTPGINNPYPINSGKQGPTQYKLEVSDITINYQWYKAKKTGGDFVNAQTVNDHINTQQKATFEIANGVGEVHNSAYKLPISSLEFNVAPMTSSYVDPIQTALIDYVYNGIYTIQPALVNNNDIDWNINAPDAFKSVSGNNTSSGTDGSSTREEQQETSATQIGGVSWQSLRSVSKNKFSNSIYKENLLDSTYKQIESALNGNGDDLSKVPFYSPNAQAWTADTDYQSSFQFMSSSSANKQNSVLLNYYQTKYLTKFLSNIYGGAGLKPEDRPVANNHNNLEKYTFLNMWKLGWMANNVNNTSDANVINDSWKNDGKTAKNNTINPEGTKEYEEVSNAILKSNKSLHDILLEQQKSTTDSSSQNDMISVAKKGLETFYTIVDPSKITQGVMYEIDNSNGTIKEVSGALNPSENASPNQFIVTNKRNK